MASRLHPRHADVALALALTAGAQAELWASGRPSALELGGALLMTLAVAVRRERPLAALAVAFGALVSQEGLGRDDVVGLSAVVALLVLSYTAGACLDAGRARIAATVALAGAWTAVLVGPEQNPDDFAFTAILALAPWLAGRAVRRYQQQAAELRDLARRLELEREQRARDAVAAERARIARDMHDVLAHNVSVMVVQAGAAEQVIDGDPAAARAALGSIRSTGKQTLRELRALLGLMREEAGGEDAPQPRLADVGALVERVREAGLAVELDVAGDRPPLDPGAELAVYRIVQEALTNTLKHAPGASASIRLRFPDGGVEATVRDRGGSATRNGDGGHGLAGMRERARLYGGDVEARAEADGFVVRAWIPGAAA